MFVVGNKQISFAHIVMVEWVEGQVDAVHPDTGAPLKMYAFKVHTSYDHEEQMLFDDEEKRREEWEKLIDDMEAAGY